MKKIGFGIIGCGYVSDRYCEGAKCRPNTELVMVMDKLKEVAKNCGEKHKVPYTDNLQDILNNKDIEAVVVSVPHYLHRPIVTECAKAGKHIMCEKPIAATMEDGIKIVEECQKRKLKLGICFGQRYTSNHIKAKKLIEEGIIGEIIDIKIFTIGYNDPLTYWGIKWRGNKEKSGGGVLIQNYSHYIDLIRYVTGLEVKEVFSVYGTFNAPGGVEVENTVNGTLKFNNGALGGINASTAACGGGEQSIYIIGTKGQIVILCDPMKVYTTLNYPELIQNQWNEIKAEEKGFSNFHLMMEDFAKAIIEDKDPPITGEDGLKSLEVVRAIYESGEKNQVVKKDMRGGKNI